MAKSIKNSREVNSWKVTFLFNDTVCVNLMKDCYDYLQSTNEQGKIMLDFARFKKITKNKSNL
jgi:hypothetical protein